MKNTVKILAAAFAMTCVFAACDNRLEEQPLTRANFVLAPEVYGAFSQPETRAVDLENPNYYNGFTREPDLIQLPIGSFVWLTYRKGTPVSAHATEIENMSDATLATVSPDWFTWGNPDLQAYVVMDAAGFNALYPVGSSGITEGGVTYLQVPENWKVSNPLYLKDGYYQFRMVSPANRIRKDNLAMQVDNGMYVYANDERYKQTASMVIRIKNNDQGVQNIKLNPMINETARIQLTINPGENVNTMEMLSMGVEISGLQNPETESGHLAFKWSSMSLRDTLVMKRGDKHARVTIRDFETTADGKIVCSTGVLPTNSMSTPSLILINLAVNGIPTQYVISLSQIKFFHGHSYNLTVEVKADGNINVMNWANQAWSGEVTLN